MCCVLLGLTEPLCSHDVGHLHRSVPMLNKEARWLTCSAAAAGSAQRVSFCGRKMQASPCLRSSPENELVGRSSMSLTTPLLHSVLLPSLAPHPPLLQMAYGGIDVTNSSPSASTHVCFTSHGVSTQLLSLSPDSPPVVLTLALQTPAATGKVRASHCGNTAVTDNALEHDYTFFLL